MITIMMNYATTSEGSASSTQMTKPKQFETAEHVFLCCNTAIPSS